MLRVWIWGHLLNILAAEAVEQFRAGMGVDRAVPVAAESALADVQQPEGFPWSCLLYTSRCV